MNPKYKEAAIPLISVDHSGKYVLTKEGQQFIRSVPGPIGVVSVAGLYRTGKSYLLNRMILNRSNGFGVGPTVNPCTKGLWCWGTPIKGESSDGEKLNILVIDTEGIGALDEDQTHDTRIFTLAILASSCFIYNSTGSIDENAIQNLSLVVNLSKHIQLSTENKDEEDPDKIANYFPKFFWVVRDFSLQMVDENGNEMNSREYLEKALAPQKGMSEDIQEKNRIRKILTSFFKERQCITLVRPLIDETKLQELDTIQFDNLRPEFANKVMELRKAITKRMKPKTLNSQKLNGELYCSMLTSYVGAINNGAVPNIQNAWHYMCQEQCTKILNESYEVFEKEIKDIKIPCSSVEIDRDLEKAQETAIQYFKKESIGDETDQFYRQLIKKIKNRISKLKAINIEEGKSAFKRYVSPSLNFISQKINKQEYESIEPFLEEVQKFEEKLTKEEPKFANWQLYLQLSTKKMLQQGFLYFVRKFRNQKQHLIKSSEQKRLINQKQLSGLKNEKESHEKKSKEQIIQLQNEKMQLLNKLEKLQFEIENTTRDQSDQVDKLTKSLFSKKKQLENYQTEYEKKLSDAQTKVFDMQNELNNKLMDWEKEKAVFEKQIEQNKEWISELEKKKNTFDAKFAQEKAEMGEKYGKQLMNEKNRVQSLSNELNIKKEDNENLLKQLNETKQKLEETINKMQIDEKKFKEEMNNKMREIKRMNDEKELEMDKIRNQFEEKNDEVNRNNQDLQERFRKTEIKMKEMKDEFKNQNTKLRHELALAEQTCKQLGEQRDEYRFKLEEMKRMHDEEREAWEADKGMYKEEEIANKINELHTQHTIQIEFTRKELEKESEKLKEQYNTLFAEKNEFELTIKLLKQNLSNEERNFEEIQENLNREIQEKDKKIKTMQRQFKTTLIQKENEMKKMISEKQKEYEEEKEIFQSAKNEFESKLSQEMIVLKNLHELQKGKLQNRHTEERDKLKKQLKEERKKYEDQLEEEKEAYEEKIETLESEFDNEVRTLDITIKQLRHEKEIIAKDRNDFEKKYLQIQTLKEKIQNEMNQKYEKLMEMSKIEKNILEKKNTELEGCKVTLEKEQLNLNHIRDNLTKLTNKQEIEINELKTEKDRLVAALEKLKIDSDSKMKAETESHMLYKKEKETTIALLQQEKSFADNQIKDLLKEKQVLIASHLTEINHQKATAEAEKLNAEEKIRTSKRIYEEKIESLKKTSNEKELELSKRLVEAEKQIAVFLQKLSNSERNLKDFHEKKKMQVESLTESLNKEKDSRRKEKSELKEHIENLSEKIMILESEHGQIKSNYEIKVKLNESEIANLNARLEREKSQYNEKINMLQKSLDDQKKKNESDKSSQEMTHQEYRSRLQLKYREERTSLKQELKDKNREIESLKKDHQRLIKELNEKYAYLNQEKLNLQRKLRKIENDLVEKEKNYEQEMQALKAQIPIIQNNSKTEIQALKITHKSKLADLEEKAKASENAKTQAMFEKEREYVKWNMEKSALEEKIGDLKDEIEKLNKDCSKLIKQNENYKFQKKKNTSQILGANRTFVYAREIPTDNKENAHQQ